MTKEDKDLLLQDLSTRLPYGVKVQYEGWNEETEEYIDVIDVLYSISVGNWISVLYSDKEVYIEGIKPYLFPLSSMTEEQKNEFNTKCLELQLKVIDNEIMYEKATEFEIDFYNKHHLDWRGLIPKELAIDATNLNIY